MPLFQAASSLRLQSVFRESDLTITLPSDHFYPGSAPDDYTNGRSETFDPARSYFELEWKVFLAKRTEVDFQAWRDGGIDRR